MEKAILGKKLGMTQIFTKTGTMIPVTVVEAGPMTVVRKKTIERDGYSAVVVAFGEVKADRVNKPEAGVFAKAGVEAKKHLKEFKYSNADSLEIGASLKCDMFADGDWVDVCGISKGHGFAGAIKRWNHQRLKETHGTGPVVRQRGSCGQRSDPSRVMKGLHMAGHYGVDKTTVQNLKVVGVDTERNVLLIHGAIPGPNGSLVTVKEAVKKQNKKGAGK